MNAQHGETHHLSNKNNNVNVNLDGKQAMEGNQFEDAQMQEGVDCNISNCTNLKVTNIEWALGKQHMQAQLRQRVVARLGAPMTATMEHISQEMEGSKFCAMKHAAAVHVANS